MSEPDDKNPSRNGSTADEGADATVSRQVNTFTPNITQTPLDGSKAPKAVLPRRDLMRYAAMVDREILPGLIAKYNPDSKHPIRHDSDVSEILRLLLQCKATVARDYLSRLREQGIDVEDIFLHVLAVAAERLGALWLDDRLDFLTVTETTGQLISLMRSMAAGYSRFQAEDENALAKDEYRILVVNPPEEQHTFGGLMVAEFFRFCGWTVETKMGMPQLEVEALLSDTHFDVVALSTSSRFPLETIANRLASFRRASVNKQLIIGIGGSLLADTPDAATLVGADFSASSAKQAVDEAMKRLTLILDQVPSSDSAWAGKA